MKWLKEASTDPRYGKYSAGRIATLWVVFVQTNIMVFLTAAGLFPAGETVKLILGLLAGPAIIYTLSTRGTVVGGEDGTTVTDPDITEDASISRARYPSGSMASGGVSPEEG